jgi:hypothetical protein
MPRLLQAASVSSKTIAAPLLGLFHKIEMRVALGNASFNSASRLPARSLPRALIPVTLASGRAKLVTMPACIGFPTWMNTIGIFEVARFAAIVGSVGVVTITST